MDKAETKGEGIKEKKGEHKRKREREREEEKAWNLLREMWWQAGEQACAFHVGIR